MQFVNDPFKDTNRQRSQMMTLVFFPYGFFNELIKVYKNTEARVYLAHLCINLLISDMMSIYKKGPFHKIVFHVGYKSRSDTMGPNLFWNRNRIVAISRFLGGPLMWSRLKYNSDIIKGLALCVELRQIAELFLQNS